MKQREIKFRAWYKGGEKMYDGFIGNYDDLYVSDLDEIFRDESLIFMQYTGLKDKNGKEIYEGDVVRDYDQIGFIKYGENDAGWLNCFLIKGDSFEQYEISENLEVIGNIYENPELIK